MTTGRINQVAVLDSPAEAGPPRCVGTEAPQRTRTCLCGAQFGNTCWYRRSETTIPSLLGRYLSQAPPLTHQALAVQGCGRSRRPSCQRLPSWSSPMMERPGQQHQLYSLLGVYALRRPHKLRVYRELHFLLKGSLLHGSLAWVPPFRSSTP